MTKMNTIGFYARSYIDALNAAFAPFAQLSPASNKKTPAARASQYDRAHAETGSLARVA